MATAQNTLDVVLEIVLSAGGNTIRTCYHTLAYVLGSRPLTGAEMGAETAVKVRGGRTASRLTQRFGRSYVHPAPQIAWGDVRELCELDQPAQPTFISTGYAGLALFLPTHLLLEDAQPSYHYPCGIMHILDAAQVRGVKTVVFYHADYDYASGGASTLSTYHSSSVNSTSAHSTSAHTTTLPSARSISLPLNSTIQTLSDIHMPCFILGIPLHPELDCAAELIDRTMLSNSQYASIFSKSRTGKSFITSTPFALVSFTIPHADIDSVWKLPLSVVCSLLGFIIIASLLLHLRLRWIRQRHSRELAQMYADHGMYPDPRLAHLLPSDHRAVMIGLAFCLLTPVMLQMLPLALYCIRLKIPIYSTLPNLHDLQTQNDETDLIKISDKPQRIDEDSIIPISSQSLPSIFHLYSQQSTITSDLPIQHITSDNASEWSQSEISSNYSISLWPLRTSLSPPSPCLTTTSIKTTVIPPCSISTIHYIEPTSTSLFSSHSTIIRHPQSRDLLPGLLPLQLKSFTHYPTSSTISLPLFNHQPSSIAIRSTTHHTSQSLPRVILSTSPFTPTIDLPTPSSSNETEQPHLESNQHLLNDPIQPFTPYTLPHNSNVNHLPSQKTRPIHPQQRQQDQSYWQRSQHDSIDYKTKPYNSSCSICLSAFKHMDIVRQLPCHHIYHPSCCDTWLTQSAPLCPLCKFNVREWCLRQST